MLTMVIKELIGKSWKSHDDPMRTTERVELAKTFIGKDAIIELTTSNGKAYFCGSQRMMDIMKKDYPNAMRNTLEDGVNMYENLPEHFAVTYQVFFNEKHAAVFDPPKFGQLSS